MKRILFFIKGLGRGGAERLLVAAAPHLDHESFEYTCAYLLAAKNALVPDLEANGIPVHRIEGSFAKWPRGLRALVQRLGTDLVHVHLPYAATGARLALRNRIRIVYTEHNAWPTYRLPTRWGNTLTFGLNDHVFAVSEEVGRSIRYPRPLGKLRMPPVETLIHGLDPRAMGREPGVADARPELELPSDAVVIGTVANFRAQKGHETLVAAAADVCRSDLTARFVLVGTGPLEERIRSRVADHGIADRIVFTGPRADVSRLLDAFDIFVLPSLYEGLPIALLEAMAAGKAVVATDVTGTREVLRPGVDGLVVPPEDPRALADAILRLARNADVRTSLGNAARARARDFDIRHAVSRWQEVYRRLLDER